jgi:predicted amidohydrolase
MGTVWWDEVELREESSPQNRVVRAMTVFHRPRGTKSAAESVEQFCKILEGAAAQKPDVICLPEGMTVVGTGKSYAEVAEAVPGPTTKRLGEVARKLNSYLVAGLYERVGPVIYNTAVLIDRKGEVVGSYRKTHLPREEVEAGLTPGSEYPVFKTDFGTVGLMICWDLQFPEPSRALALKGAEVILLPIWGGSDILARARAIENHVFLLTSSYDMKTFIVAPDGAVLAEATAAQPVAVAELKLDEKIVQPWLGDMKPRTWKERRPDLPVEAVRKPAPNGGKKAGSR